MILQDCTQWLSKRHMKAFVNLVQEANFYRGVCTIIQTTGIGKLRPNIVMLGFKNNWASAEQNQVADYFKTIQYV